MKAVIETGSKQYLVEKGDVLVVELLGDKKTVTFDAMMLVDGEKSVIGKPLVEGTKVTATVIDPEEKQEKVKIMKFKAKKRVKTLTGHRQRMSRIEITDISK